jgi:hypothetical protein
MLLKIGGLIPEIKKVRYNTSQEERSTGKNTERILVDVYSSCCVINCIVIFQAHIIYVLNFSAHIYERGGRDCSRSSSSYLPESSIKVRLNCGITII